MGRPHYVQFGSVLEEFDALAYGRPDLCRASVFPIGAILSKLSGICVKVRNSESRFVYPVDSMVLLFFSSSAARRASAIGFLAGNEWAELPSAVKHQARCQSCSIP